MLTPKLTQPVRALAKGRNWQRMVAQIAAPSLEVGQWTVLLLRSNGTVEIGKSYETARSAFQQASRVGNELSCNSYVATRFAPRALGPSSLPKIVVYITSHHVLATLELRNERRGAAGRNPE